MKPIAKLAAIALALHSFPPAGEAAEPAKIVSYSCKDTVAVGRVKTLDYTDLSTKDDLIGHGQFSMQITVKRLIHGKDTRRVLPAAGIAHGQLREDRDFLLVLSPSSGDGYTLRTAALWDTRPRPVASSECD